MGAGTYVQLSLCSLLITTFFFFQEARTCPSEWLFYHDKCYGIFTEGATWSDAEATCQRFGPNGHLASFHSAQEDAIVAKRIINSFPEVQRVWIGFHDPRGTGRWKWSDSSTTNFRPWSEGEPIQNAAGWSCASTHISSGFIRWDTWDCRLKMSFVCKRDS